MRRSLITCAVLLSLALASAPARAQSAREVTYTPESVVPLRAKLRFTTMIILPEQEEILDFVCGDKEFWAVSGAQNLAYVKPAKAGAVTNLNLVTASGRVYSFVLTEGAADPDLKVFVQLDGSSAATGRQKFYTARQVEDLQREIDDARKDAEDARKQLEGARTVRDRTGLSRSTIWRLERRGEFPRHRRISANVVAWVETEVVDWIQSRVKLEVG